MNRVEWCLFTQSHLQCRASTPSMCRPIQYLHVTTEHASVNNVIALDRQPRFTDFISVTSDRRMDGWTRQTIEDAPTSRCVLKNVRTDRGALYGRDVELGVPQESSIIYGIRARGYPQLCNFEGQHNWSCLCPGMPAVDIGYSIKGWGLWLSILQQLVFIF